MTTKNFSLTICHSLRYYLDTLFYNLTTDKLIFVFFSCFSQIVSGGGDSAIILWDVATGQPLRRLRGHAARVSVTRFNEESSMVVSGSQDGTARCWDVRSRTTREAEMVLTEATDAISSLFVTDHEIVTGSFDGKVRRYDLRAGELTTDCTGRKLLALCYLVSDKLISLSWLTTFILLP